MKTKILTLIIALMANSIFCLAQNHPLQTKDTIISECQANYYYVYDDIISDPDGSTTWQLTYYFSDYSQGNPTSWYWNFGDGTSSTDQNPVHTFPANGTYNVCLTISGNNCQSSYCSLVTVGYDTPAGCDAYFYYSFDDSIPSTDGANTAFQLTYYFSDYSSGYPNNWYWDFGDGTSSTDQNPIHIFPSDGSYNVCLTISGDSCQSSYCSIITVGHDTIIPECEAYFYYSYDDTISYNDSSTTWQTAYYFSDYSTGNPTNWYWNFGDGSFSTEQNPVHTFPGNGSYNVCLTISGEYCQSSYCSLITVGFDSTTTGCQAYYYYSYGDSIPSTDGSTTSQLSCYFVDYSSGNPTNWYWDFGDGTFSTDQNTFHTFPSDGTYNVCLTISGDSCQSSYCSLVTVGFDTISSECNADFYYWNTNYPDSIYFYDYSSVNSPADYITSWTWDFGDGTSSNYQYPTHAFAPGFYNVCLTINTASGCSSTFCQYVQVGYYDSTACNLYVTVNSIINESSTGASDGAINIDVFGGTPPYSFIWSNGSVSQNISGLTKGYYDVTVTDNSGLQGCQTWATFEILNESDTGTIIFMSDTLLSANPIDTCFNFQPASANIYSFNFVNNNTISITWIVYDSQGSSHGFVTINYQIDFSGYYIVMLTIECGKGAYNFTDQIHIIHQASGISKINMSNDKISLFPNPVSDKLNITINLEKPDQIFVNILNVTGQIIYSEKVDYESGQKVLKINTSALSKGLYFVKVNYNNGQSLSDRFIK